MGEHRAGRFASVLLPKREFCYRVMCSMKLFCCENCNKYENIMNCFVNSGKEAEEHKYGTIEVKPMQVTSERCLAKASRILHFRGKKDAKHANQIQIFSGT